MSAEINTLVITAAAIGFVHTLAGPDHYLPFAMLSWARKWSTAKTCLVTLVCGLGHIASSIVLGLVGVGFGVAIGKLEILESVRGNVAAWLLIGFGLAYLIWGLRQAYKNKPHTHIHDHHDGDSHEHQHIRHTDHSHVHEQPSKSNITPWALFVIFIFGPCEPLIPLLMYPAAKSSFTGLLIVTGVFGVVTVGTMVGMVLLSVAGFSFVPFNKLARYSHAVGGATICLCGLSIRFMGL